MVSPCPANLGFMTENACMTDGNAMDYGEYGIVLPSGPQNDYDAALQRSWWNYPPGKPASRAMVVDGPNVQGGDPVFNPHGVPMRTVSVRIALNLTEAGAYCFKAAVGSASNPAPLGRPSVFLAISEQPAPDGNSLWHDSGTPMPGNVTNLNLAASQPQSLASAMLQTGGWQFLTANLVVANPGVHYFYVVLDNNAPNASFQGINYIIDDIEIYRSQVSPSLTVSALPAEICAGNSSVLTAAGADIYTWSAGTLPAAGASVAASPASNATYTVTGRNGGDPSCTSTASITITVNPSPTITASAAPPSICPNESSVLTATGADNYQWLPGGTAGPQLTVTPAATETYTVTGTDANGCTGEATVTVLVGNSLSLSVDPPTPSVCLGRSVTLTASGANDYVWLPSGEVGPKLTVSPTQATTYTVTGANADGCTGSATVVVTIAPDLTVGIDPPAPVVCRGDSVSLTATGADTYLWQPGGNTQPALTLLPQGPVSYTVTGADATGCTGSATVSVTVSDPPLEGVSGSPASICRGMGGVPLWVRDFQGEVLFWEASKDGGQTWFSIGKAGFSEIESGRLTVTTWFRPVIGSPGCPPNRDTPPIPVSVVRTADAVDVGEIEGPDAVCLNDLAQFVWNQPSAGVIENWIVESSAGTTSYPASGPAFSLPLNQAPDVFVSAEIRTPCGLTRTPVHRVELRQPLLPTLTVRRSCGSVATLEVGPESSFREVQLSGGNILRTLTAPPFITALPYGTYAVQTTDTFGCQAISPAVLAVGLPEGPPIVELLPQAGQAALRWAAVDGPTVYQVAYRIVGETQWRVLPETTAFQGLIRNLQHNTAYEVQIRVRCANAAADVWSSGPIREFRTPPLAGTTGLCSGGPPWPIPGGFKIDRLTARDIAVSWAQVPDAAGYIVSCGLASLPHNQWPQWVICNPKHNYVVGGLTPGRSYGVHVRTNCTNCTTALQSTDRRSAWSMRIDFDTPQMREHSLSVLVAGSLKLYPNPAQDEVYWESDTAGVVEVYELTGRRVETFVINTGVTVASVSGWPASVYVWRWRGLDGSSESGKIVIAR